MRTQIGRILALAFASSALAVHSLAIQRAQAASFVEAGSLSTGRVAHTATLLPGGKVLVVGGTLEPSTELYEPDAAGPPPSLTLLRNADQTLSLSWTGAGVLEQTEHLTAPNWQPAPSQDNPQVINTTEPKKFIRVKAE